MTDLPWASMAIVAAALLGVLAVGEIGHRRLGLASELTRRLDHAAAGPVLLVLPGVFASPWPVLLLSAGFAALLVVARLAGQLESVHGIQRASAGAFLYPAAIATTFVLAHERPERYVIAIAALVFADAASGLVGARWGRTSYVAWGHEKSLEGSVAAFVVTALAAVAILVLAGMPLSSAALVAAFTGLVVALVESALPWGLDNLGVPLAALAALAVAGSPLQAGLVLVAALTFCWLAMTRREPVGRTSRRAIVETVSPETG